MGEAVGTRARGITASVRNDTLFPRSSMRSKGAPLLAAHLAATLGAMDEDDNNTKPTPRRPARGSSWIEFYPLVRRSVAVGLRAEAHARPLAVGMRPVFR